MIVAESDIRKTQPNHHDPSVTVASSRTPLIPAESPPAYTPREDAGPSSSSAPPYHGPPPPPATQKQRPKRTGKRFAKALLLAFCAYGIIAFTVHFIVVIIRGPMHDFRRKVGHPEPEDGRIVRCIRGGDVAWSPTPRIQFPSFSIPLDSNAIYVLARGLQATGGVTVVSHQTTASDEVIVDIAAQLHEWDVFMGTTVCLMERVEGEWGVGIFSPKHLTRPNQRTEVEITVKIPRQPATPVLELPRFEILTPDFEVTLPNADEFVDFHNLTIHTSNKPVAVRSVKAANIDIQTSNFGIHGTFITNSSLSLTTSNAPITAKIFLENDYTSGKETHTTTTDGSFNGDTSLSNTGAPRCTIRAATTNAELKLAFPQHSSSSHPPSSPILDIVGTTSNGPAELLLQPSFEGAFDVSTTNTYQAGFSSGSTPENDPLGLGRQQHVDFTTNVDSKKGGRIYWGDLDDGPKLGRVELSTSNGRASLHIQ